MRTTILALVSLLAACASPPPADSPPPSAPIPKAPPLASPAKASPSATPSPEGTSAAAAPTAAASAAPAEDDEFAKVTIKVEKVAGSVYMLEGQGGNIGVSVGEDGVILVDDQFAPLAPKIREALKGITDKPIRFILNTHWHFDHTGGNALFGQGAPIVAHENVRARLAAGGAVVVGGQRREIPPASKEALPVLTFHDKVSIHLNGEEVRAIHVPTGHTDGDIIVHFTKSNVVHMGDNFVTYGFPFVDLGSGGSVRGLVAALERLAKELPADVKVIPGHGKVSGVEDMKKLAAALKDCVKLVEAEVKKKKTLEQVQEAKVLAKYDELGKGFMKTSTFTEIVYKELTKQPAGFKPH